MWNKSLAKADQDYLNLFDNYKEREGEGDAAEDEGESPEDCLHAGPAQAPLLLDHASKLYAGVLAPRCIRQRLQWVHIIVDRVAHVSTRPLLHNTHGYLTFRDFSKSISMLKSCNISGNLRFIAFYFLIQNSR